MRHNSLGEIIRSLRKKACLSQEELADGICSPVSISRIENGAQMPSGTVLEALLARLGTSTYQLCDIYYRSEKQQAFEQEAEMVGRAVAAGKMDEAKERLVYLAGSTGTDSLNMQYFLMLDASVKLAEGAEPEKTLSILHQALAQTKSSFDPEDFRGVLLSVREANILNIMAAALFRCGRPQEAIRLGEELMSSLKRHKSGLQEYQIIKINLAFNLAQCLEKEGRYSEAFIYIQMAEELSLNGFEQALLPEIEFGKAKLYHLLGDDGACEAIIRAIVPYMELVRKTEFAGIVRSYAQKELGITEI
ncbi:MAG: helix-turn-helix domain-containing protein [Lachnospiraceae bacterium]|jgi:transcriptional regulator with XRE-family HTH domain|nr:helix-turn-helix transcriptional regulator [uncultured Schaedlerella sp.]MCI8985176.1 helix-turn-helix domain-containing protein [Lachnospiraceae bacterium]MCI9255195.1 helix-turn-helix domain-containing protein [Lachnospiraceae bacterium]